MPSTLFYAATIPTVPTLEGDFTDGRYIVVGEDANGYFCHGQPGAPIPKGARVLCDGKNPWTWNQVAQRLPADMVELTPHEWAGENTAQAIDTRPFTKYEARRVAAETKSRVR